MLIQSMPAALFALSRANTRVAHTLVSRNAGLGYLSGKHQVSLVHRTVLCRWTAERLMIDAARAFTTSRSNFNRQPSLAERIMLLSPKPVQPYLALMRFDKPIGTWLTLLPSLWSLALASGTTGHLFDLKLAALFCLGAFLMRGAGCTVNDMWDADFDRRVARTTTRPIASRQITRKQAFVFLGVQLSCALAVLMQLNQLSIAVGAASVPLVVAYPLFKRFTYWPQLMLGITFNWGTLMGWTAICNALETPALCLLTAGISWTLLYDTIYAHQDKADDMMIGVKSTALLFGERTKPFLRVCGVTTIASLALAAQLTGAPWPVYAGLTGMAAHFVWQIETLQLDNTADCLRKFKSNRDVGLLMLASLLLGNFIGFAA